ncbi:MAG: phenylalanine--tRNA ligase subunit alpha [Tissierellia bacterium]|nr:phenylalanine--tRNA ligase subunit alpha [Tissierellia bacterium]
MKERLQKIKGDTLEKIEKIGDLADFEEIRIKILGKKGELTKVLRGMGQIPAEERPAMGKLANEIRAEIEEKLEGKRKELEEKIKKIQEKKESIDVTANPQTVEIGHRHPLHQTMEELEDLFLSMGFDIIDGPEIETVENNFDLLNSPKDHPSRDRSDTFYIDDKTVLRTHTSPVQIRVMKSQELPIRMVSAGRTFRFDEVDDTHSPMFHQLEGLVVDKNVTMANLIDTLDMFIHALFGKDMKTRYRPHYFPFTEPSIEVDVSCFDCKGRGCDACHYTGWSMELLGGGLVHPKVLENCGIDSSIYSGFAFGLGVDRITMVKHNISDIRLLYENDQRFLEQF